MKKMFWLLGLFLLTGSVNAWAAGDPCEQDRPKVCGDITPGKGAVHSCMLANASSLSNKCREAVQNTEYLVQQFMTTCQSDTRRFCASEMDLRPNDVLDCMRRNKEKYSAACKRLHNQYKAYHYSVTE